MQGQHKSRANERHTLDRQRPSGSIWARGHVTYYPIAVNNEPDTTNQKEIGSITYVTSACDTERLTVGLVSARAGCSMLPSTTCWDLYQRGFAVDRCPTATLTKGAPRIVTNLNDRGRYERSLYCNLLTERMIDTALHQRHVSHSSVLIGDPLGEKGSEGHVVTVQY